MGKHQQGQKRKRPISKNFEVVPQDFCAPKADLRHGSKKKGQNTLANAFSGAMSKAEERWFRKAGYGEVLHTAYYRGQKHVIPLDEYAAFEAAIQKPLPVTFRLCDAAFGGSLEQELHSLSDAVVAPVPWAPGSSGIWQVAPSIDKKALSKASDGSVAKALSTILGDGVSAGLLHRQECVSMLPVLALKAQPGSYVLDTCSSPGSKTMQLLECISREGNPRGVVIANDAHPKRVGALLDSIQRHSRPVHERKHLIVSCHRGEGFPMPARPFRHSNHIRKASNSSSPASSSSSGGLPGSRQEAAAIEGSIGFDRVLCDVPCSGDGTIRKDPTVLPRWTPAVGTQLHATQLAIAWRGLELLKVGGLMCYSTCSLNPIEDEAVVAALLQRTESIAPGAVRLEAWPSDVLPGLVRRPGLSHWRVADHVEVESQVAATMHLQRCSRMLPHDQDTGGFFIALLRKRKPLADGGAAAGSSSAETMPALPSLPATGPSACRELPELPAQDKLTPLPKTTADEIAASRSGLPKARQRLLRRGLATGNADDDVFLGPAALAAFDADSLCIAHAGVPLKEVEEA